MRFHPCFALLLPAASVLAQPSGPTPDPPPQPTASAPQPARTFAPEPKRILGIIPNYRAVSAGETAPPPSAKEAFRIATESSFDYSAFIFVGMTSGLADGRDAHPQLGVGAAGYARYYWRGFVDKTDGNYLVLFALPSLFHQDERYYAKGEGGLWERAAYAASRVAITPDDRGRDSFNISEILGRGIAQIVSTAYYPSQARTIGALGSKYGFALVGDAATNVFLELWPDVAAQVSRLHFHRHSKSN